MTSDAPWYSEEAGFFGPHYLEEYVDLLPTDRTRAEVDFLESILALPPGAPILDLCCGHGRHAVELAGRGYAVTGQDLNHYFLGEAARKALDRGVEVRWVQRDMRDMRFEEEFDAVVNLFTAFGYFDTDAENFAVLPGVRRALRPGGRFVMDLIHRDHLARKYQPRRWRALDDGSTLLEESWFDFVRGRNTEHRVRLWPDGRRREMDLSLRIYALNEVVDACTAAGLEYVASYGDYADRPLDFDATRCVLVTRRPTGT